MVFSRFLLSGKKGGGRPPPKLPATGPVEELQRCKGVFAASDGLRKGLAEMQCQALVTRCSDLHK